MPPRSLRASWFAPLALAVVLWPASAAAAWPSNPAIDLPVSLAPGSKGPPFVCSDGAGGAFVAWRDDRNAATSGIDLYMQHLTAAGTVATGWPANGLAVCNATGTQIPADLIPDGSGGAYVTWRDFRAGNSDIYLLRVSRDATPLAGWPVNGLAVSTRLDDEGADQLALDEAGGVFVVWGLSSAGPTVDDLYATRLAGNGTTVAGWPAGGKALVATTAFEDMPSIAVATDGRLMVAYSANGSGSYDIRLGFFVAANGTVSLDLPVCAAAGNQTLPHLVSNGAGGAELFWTDARTATTAVYGSAVLANGSIPTGWPANGQSFFTSSAGLLDVVSDDHGGAWVLVANDNGGDPTLELARVMPSGAVIYPIVNGFAGITTGGAIVPDGQGGVILGWQAQLLATLGSDIYGLRLDLNGSVVAGWQDSRNPGPHLVCGAPGDQFGVALTDDGGHGAILVWDDDRTGGSELYAQRVERFGALGNPEPAITGVQDVKNDQGGVVRVAWNASYLDAEPNLPIAAYRLWRQLPAAAATQALREGRARIVEPGVADLGATGVGTARALRITERDGAQYFWEPAGVITAAGLAGYSVAALTAGDSSAAGNPLTAFMVDALAADGRFWSSAADSGYSIDNLAPATPSPFTGTFASGIGASLFWGASTEPDFAAYRLYRGVRPDFPPGPASLVSQAGTPGYFDAGASPAYYKLSAVDVHGNESAFAFLLPAGALAVDDVAAPREVALAPLAPNPARGRGVTVAFALPRAMHARLAVYDVQGRRVRSLLAGMLDAGNHVRAWDGRDDGGTGVAAAVYLVRLETSERTLTRRMVWMP